jgi:hypothetical protein
MTRLKTPEYMRIHASLLPKLIIDHYKLDVIIAPDGYIYVRIDGGIYGLKQACVNVVRFFLLASRMNIYKKWKLV